MSKKTTKLYKILNKPQILAIADTLDDMSIEDLLRIIALNCTMITVFTDTLKEFLEKTASKT